MILRPLAWTDNGPSVTIAFFVRGTSVPGVTVHLIVGLPVDFIKFQESSVPKMRPFYRNPKNDFQLPIPPILPEPLIFLLPASANFTKVPTFSLIKLHSPGRVVKELSAIDSVCQRSGLIYSILTAVSKFFFHLTIRSLSVSPEFVVTKIAHFRRVVINFSCQETPF